jgi:hypothetical protein
MQPFASRTGCAPGRALDFCRRAFEIVIAPVASSLQSFCKVRAPWGRNANIDSLAAYDLIHDMVEHACNNTPRCI